MATRVVVFIDWQNVYRAARRSFESLAAAHWRGQVNPRVIGDAIANQGDADRQLSEVRVYAGMPDSRKEPKANGARSRQVAAWARLASVRPIWRPLQYPREFAARG